MHHLAIKGRSSKFGSKTISDAFFTNVVFWTNSHKTRATGRRDENKRKFQTVMNSETDSEINFPEAILITRSLMIRWKTAESSIWRVIYGQKGWWICGLEKRCWRCRSRTNRLLISALFWIWKLILRLDNPRRISQFLARIERHYGNSRAATPVITHWMRILVAAKRSI